MTATPDHFLDSAVSILNSPNASEINYRNSASRAYYAAFHCCYAERSRCPNLNANDILGSHDKLYKRFEELPHSNQTVPLKRMAYMAKIMKTVRKQADYNLNEDFQKRDC